MKQLLIALGLFNFSLLTAQQLDQHRWQDRLIIIVSNSFQNADLQKQFAILQTDETGLMERKLLVYQFSGEQYKTGLDSATTQTVEKGLLKRFEMAPSGFSIYLVGLDGGIKLKADQPVSLQKLYALIDSMPMRRTELSRKKKNQEP